MTSTRECDIALGILLPTFFETPCSLLLFYHCSSEEYLVRLEYREEREATEADLINVIINYCLLVIQRRVW